MWFNHHHLCDELGIDLKGPCIPQSQKDWGILWRDIKYYFSMNRIKDCEDWFEVVFNITYKEFKDNVVYCLKEKDSTVKYTLFNATKYLLNKFRDWIVGWYNVYRNRWRNGFYDGETYSLDYTSAVYLYERVKRYREKAKGFIKIGWDDYSEEEIKKGDKPHMYTIPVLKLRDIDTCKDNFEHWFNIRDTKYRSESRLI